MDDNTSTSSTGKETKRHSLGSKFWQQLRVSKRKSKSSTKPTTFVSYCAEDNISDAEDSFISLPTNFQRREVDRQSISLDDISIHECPFDVTGYGKLLLKDKFKLRKPKRKKVIVFLFEKIIVLTVEDKKQDSYYYYGSIKISNLIMTPDVHNPRKIYLKDFTNSKLSENNIEYKLEAKTEEIRSAWKDVLLRCLWMQLVSAKAEQQRLN
ncbi:hypothetical protein NQ315_004727 [Exocentrus adspersus]|uniref:PH domain-containing protein n=1 Tax=Exocentrus adspersus TaxID=1586481 RepID=A0AAV8W1R5_9CUCU|nr:hypothetical protein NQ315_004727 [Exocentrus adspersus]